MTEYQRRGLKTTDAQVKECLRLYHEEGWSQGRIARHMGIAAVTVGRYVRGESRREVSGDPVADHALLVEPAPEALAESMARLTQLIETPPEEDPLEEIMRRRSAAASTAAQAARVQHNAQSAEENSDESVEQTDGAGSNETP
jgi:predicted transcriptional regulator